MARIHTGGDELTAAEEIRVQEIQALADTSTTEALGKTSGSVVKVSRAAALGADDNYVTDAEKVVIGNTSGVNTGDAALGADDNYVTDAEKVVIGNTSGVNTGDNATNSQYSGDYRPSGTDVAIADGGTGQSTALAAMTALAFQSGARAYRSTGQTIATGTFTKVQLNSENWDGLNEFDSVTNYRFVASVAGRYSVKGQVYMDASSGGSLLIIDIRKNNSPIAYLQEPMGTGARGISTSTDVLLSINDYIDMYVYHDSGANRNIYASGSDSFTFLSIQRLT